MKELTVGVDSGSLSCGYPSASVTSSPDLSVASAVIGTGPDPMSFCWANLANSDGA